MWAGETQQKYAGDYIVADGAINRVIVDGMKAKIYTNCEPGPYVQDRTLQIQSSLGSLLVQ